MSDPRPGLLEKTVAQALEACGVSSAGGPLVVAFSGGPDSMALLDVLATLRYPILAAHLDHQLRSESAADAEFCAAFCRQRAIDVRVGRADVRERAARDGAGIEDAARRERYAFLRGVRDAVGARWIVVAHTQDDQAETVLLRLLRGSGPTGLAGMREKSGDLLRPLLSVGREAVLDHLAARGLTPRQDSSNADLDFLRNRVRQELLPYLASRFNPSVRSTLARTAGLLAEQSELLEEQAGQLWARVARRDGASVILDRRALAEVPLALARLVVRRAFAETGGLEGVTAAHVEAMLHLGRPEAPSGRRRFLPAGREAACSFDDLRLGPRQPAAPFSLPLEVPGRVDLPDGRIVRAEAVETSEAEGDGQTIVAATGALTVRTRRPGDRIRRKGRRMSLRRYLMEQRVPASERGGLPLVAAGTDVLWIPGRATAESGPGRLVRLSLTGGA